ncbi:MAG: DUF2946 family protein [Novosphingobium sp.]
MNALRRLNPALLLALLVAALALRMVVPSGFMPVADAHGLRMAICSGSGPAFVELDPGHKAPASPEVRDPCPYGLAAHAALDLPPSLALPAAPERFAVLPYPGLAAARLTAWRALRPPARGPPAFA